MSTFPFTSYFLSYSGPGRKRSPFPLRSTLALSLLLPLRSGLPLPLRSVLLRVSAVLSVLGHTAAHKSPTQNPLPASLLLSPAAGSAVVPDLTRSLDSEVVPDITR